MNSNNERLRSVMRYVGGKSKMLDRLLPLIPQGGEPYCEPYIGGGSVFMARAPAPVEVINDLDGDIVNLFRCLQNKYTFEELRHRIFWTPYALDEFRKAVEILQSDEPNPVMRAWAKFVAHNQSMGGHASAKGNWGRAFIASSGMAHNVNIWLMRQTMLDAWRWRLMRAQIDHRDALAVIRYWDGPKTVFYLDPPYIHDTRSKHGRRLYSIECTDAHHQELVKLLLTVKGSVTLSGYRHCIYEPLERNGWRRIDFPTVSGCIARARNTVMRGKGALLAHCSRTESVWLNPRAQALLGDIDTTRTDKLNGSRLNGHYSNRVGDLFDFTHINGKDSSCLTQQT